MNNKVRTLAVDSTNWLYLLLAFPIIDYVLRKLPVISMIAPVWDKITLLVLSIFTLFAYLKATGKMPGIKHLFAAFFIYGLCSMFTDMSNFGVSVEGFRAIYQYMICFFFGFYLIRSEEDLEKYIKVLAVVGFLVGFYGVMQVVFKVQTNEAWVGEGEATTTRAFSIVTSPNVLGSYMALITPLCMGLFFHSKTRIAKMIWAIFALSSFAALLGTGSRGAQFAFAFVILVAGAIWDKRVFKYLLIAAVLGATLFAVVPKETPVVGKIKDRITSLFTPEYMEKSSKDGRIKRWSDAYDQMRLEPLFGAGVGHWGGAVASRNFGVIYTDSYLFKSFAELGIIGLTMLIGLVVLALRYTLRAVRKMRGTKYFFLGLGLYSGLFAVALHNCVENIFEVPFMMTVFWLMCGMMTSLSLRGKDVAADKTQHTSSV